MTADRSATPPEPSAQAREVARKFHEAYERLAPSFGYTTRTATAVPWGRVPENNRRLMEAVSQEVLDAFAAARVEELTVTLEAERMNRRDADAEAERQRQDKGRLRAIEEAARNVVDDASVEFDDERLRYLAAQITRGDWQALVAALESLDRSGTPS